MSDDLDHRDDLLKAALEFAKNEKGIRQDRMVFEFLAGACKALHMTGYFPSECPPFLFVIGVRGGDRVKEAQRMLAEREAPREATLAANAAAAEETVTGSGKK